MSTINGLDISQEEKDLMIKKITENSEKNDILLKSAKKGAISAIIARNFSHNIGDIVFKNNSFHTYLQSEEFKKYTQWMGNTWETFWELFIKDTEKLRNHPAYNEYISLRKKYTTPVETLKNLSWWKYLQTWGIDDMSNVNILEHSKIGSLDFCAGRMVTILGILYLCEWKEYVEKNIQCAEVNFDILETIIRTNVHENARDTSWLQETMNYEDPHGILVVEGQQIDPNIFLLEQQWWEKIPEHNITSIPENPLEYIYLQDFIMYLNTMLTEEEKRDTEGIFQKLLDEVHQKYGNIETILKYKIIYWSEENTQAILDIIDSEIPILQKRFWYALIQFNIGNFSWEEFNNFISQKYGKNFNLRNVLGSINLG